MSQSLLKTTLLLLALTAVSLGITAQAQDKPQLLITNGNGLAIDLEEATVEIQANGDVHIDCKIGETGGCDVQGNTGTIEIPQLSFSASNPNVVEGQPLSLTWSSNTEVCVGQGSTVTGWAGKVLASAGVKTLYPAVGTHTLRLKCYAGAGSIERTVGPIVVTPAGGTTAPVIHEFYANPYQGPAPLVTRLSWTSSFVQSCTGSVSGQVSTLTGWTGNLPVLGERVLTLSANGTYTFKLTCQGLGGSTNKSITVTVGSPPPPANCTGITVPTSVLTRQDLTFSFIPDADQVYTLKVFPATVTPTNPTAEPASDAVFTISQCPGDFRAPVASPPANELTLGSACRLDSRQGSLTFGAVGCKLVAGRTYYLNSAMKTSFAAVTQAGHTCGSFTSCEVNATLSSTQPGSGGETCSVTHPMIKPAGFIAHTLTWGEVFFDRQFPEVPSFLTPVGAFTLRHLDRPNRGPMMQGRYITIPVMLEANVNYNLRWLEAQPIAAADYRSGRPADRIFVSAGPCSGDLRAKVNGSSDPALSACRGQSYSGNFFFGTYPEHQCPLSPGLNYITIAMVDPSDGLDPWEMTCRNNNFDGTLNRCEGNFRFSARPRVP